MNGNKSESSQRLPSRSFDENWDSIFGSRKPARGKWRIDEDGNEVPYDAPSVEAHLEIMGDEYYASLQATDGTPIDTRRRHREYMKENGLSLCSDYGPGYYEKRKAAIKAEDDKDRHRTLLDTVAKLEANPRLAVRRRGEVDPRDE